MRCSEWEVLRHVSVLVGSLITSEILWAVSCSTILILIGALCFILVLRAL